MEVRRELIIRALAWTGAGLAGAVVLSFVLLFTLDISLLFRHPIEEALSRLAGRQVIINGEVRLIAWPYPALRLGNVFIANTPDGTRPDLVLARRAQARLQLRGFPRTRLIVRSVDMDGVNVTLEQSKSGMSWMLPGAAQIAGRSIKIRRIPFPFVFKPQSLVATNVTFALRMAHQTTGVTYAVDRLTAQNGGPLGAYVALVGRRGKEVWHADADLSSLRPLLTGKPFKIKGRVSGLGARLAFAGSLALDSWKASALSGIGEAVDTQRLWSGPSSAKPTPANFTFSLKNMNQVQALLIHFQQFGSGDLDAVLEFSGPSSDRITGRIGAKTLDLAALPRPEIAAKGKRFLSSQPLGLGALAHSQIDLKLDAESVTWHETPIGRLTLGIWADNRVIAAGPLTLDGPQTQITGDATLDLRAVPKLSLSFKAKLGNLSALLGSAEDLAHSTRADIAFELMGTGQSLAQIMATSYGQTDVLVGPGDAGEALASALPLEIAYGLKKDHSLAPLPGTDRPLGLKCLVSRFDIAEGRATSRALFVETSAATTTGAGNVDFANESLDLHLAPRPKDPDLIGQARDFDLRGTLRDPVFAPRDAAAKGLSRMASETALAPTFDVIMPLLGPEALFANPCVRSLMSESALAALRQQRTAATGNKRAEAP